MTATNPGPQVEDLASLARKGTPHYQSPHQDRSGSDGRGRLWIRNHAFLLVNDRCA
ncbi:hypothetical protein L915_15410 [Phytophthora nicotianae]|uniref:Uncharacterized protein n=1 Tax=Phytophthora nicotianae TaxID=4792 RepID=W2G6E8_PHYNI|nr:hypothetical protein L915_15410 [Phytophthora nicotianae]